MDKHPHKTENVLLKEYLFTALIKLMDQKDFKDIKITEIAKKAGVSRMTYYRTYSSKEDIMIQYMEDQSRHIILLLEEHPEYHTEEIYCLFYSYFKEQAHLMTYLYKAGLLNEVIHRLTSFVTQTYERSNSHLLDKSQKSYEINFISGGLFLLLKHWIESGLKETPEEMARMTMKILHISSSEPTS